MSLQFQIVDLMYRFGWSQAFAIEYLMARENTNVDHHQAIEIAKASPYIKWCDIPKGV